MTIQEAYEKYKHHDEQFTRWLGEPDDDYLKQIIADCWLVIKKHTETSIESPEPEEVNIICAKCGREIYAADRAHKGNLWGINYHRGCRPIHAEKTEVEK